MIVDLIKYCYSNDTNIYQHVNDFPAKILISAFHRACCGRTKFGFINVGNAPKAFTKPFTKHKCVTNLC